LLNIPLEGGIARVFILVGGAGFTSTVATFILTFTNAFGKADAEHQEEVLKEKDREKNRGREL
jgi:hypothetical protein